jgi:tetratricopeptide (TPR) repeat protein
VDDDSPGRDPGHQGFSWDDYVSWLVEREGSLAAVAQRLAALRAWKDDAGSIERALRRLRARGQRDGGTWGARALLAFGLPDAASARTRWMGAYHSRFTDLPLPVCEDLLRLWDRPPIADAPPSALFLALGQATCALRRQDRARADPHLARARSLTRGAPPDARAELLLVEAFVASDTALLAPLPALLAEPMDPADRACLHARHVDQLAYGHNQRGDYEESERLYRSIPDAAPPFALSRRANGLAYLRHRQGKREEAARLATEAASHAGDGGHLRIRGMALSMLARVLGSPGGDEPRRRALAIARSLDDESLRLRFAKPLPPAAP